MGPVPDQWRPRMPSGATCADDVRMDQSIYEDLRPDGFIATPGAERRHLQTMGRTGLLPKRLFEADGQIRVAALGENDLPAVNAMLGRCSRATLYKRFHGFADGLAHAASMVSDATQGSYGAWNAGRCVGMATLAVSGEDFGHIGVLVEDAWQRRGAGTALVTALVRRAHELGLAGLVADVLSDNYFVLPLFARIGTITTTFAYSGYRVRIGFGSPLIGSAIRSDVPVRELTS